MGFQMNNPSKPIKNPWPRVSTLLIPIVYTLVAFSLVIPFEVYTLEIRTISSALENVYTNNISQVQRHIFVYEASQNQFDSLKNEQSGSKFTLKVVCTAEHHSNPECPLMLIVNHGKSLVFWEIYGASPPDNSSSDGVLLSTVERTICFEGRNLPSESEFTVEMSTCSKTPIRYFLSAHLRRDLIIPLNTLTKTQLTPTSPSVYFFPATVGGPELVFIQLSSTSALCMLLSIQQPECPISDTIDSIRNHGQWQSVTVKTGLTIQRSEFPNGFFIILLLLPEDSLCNQKFGWTETATELNISSDTFNSSDNKPNDLANLQQSMATRRKTIHFLIRSEIPTKNYHFALMMPLGLFLTFISAIFMIHLHFHHVRCNLYKSGATPSPSRSLETLSTQRGMGSTDSILRSRIQISELINGHNGQPERLMEQSKRYYMAGILVASFYCVPVFQLILSYHKRLQETGNFDLCYFNYLCSHMFGMFHDFNHIYSNIGYLICGPVFIGIVYLRQATVDNDPKTQIDLTSVPNQTDLEKGRAWIPRAPWDISKGVFVHHGLFYAMGFSLFMTGVMSGAYHICPNMSNFQFDTCFMYTIAALGVVTIYQFRHPTYVSASLTFMTLAVVAASTVLGLLWESTKFRLFFTISHLTFLLVILTYIHYVGYIRVNGVTVTEWRKMFLILRQKWTDDVKKVRLIGFQKDVWSPRGEPNTVVLPGPCRLIFPILVMGVNTGCIIMIWTVMREANFASQVLAVYVINSSVYSIYYIIRKIVHYECRGKLWLQPLIYITTSLCLWAYSLSYFGDVVTLWERSPAESRAKNAECVFLGFYDSHDVWHFISSAALFSSLMGLLTMDDDLIDRPKSEIPVF